VENNFILNQFQAREGSAPDPNPVFGPPEYYNAQFSGMNPSGSLPDGNYAAWSTVSSQIISPSGPYYIFDTYVKTPPYPWNSFGPQYGAVNWLLNHKPTSVTYQTNCDPSGNNCTSSGTTTDARTIRDVIQQTIWMIFSNGTPTCCSLLDTNLPGNPPPPTNPQYNASFVPDNIVGNAGGGYNITAAVNSLYNQALANTGFVPSATDTFVLFILDSTGALIEIPPPIPPQLSVVKTPKNGTFTSGAQVSFTFVVSNPAPTGGQSAANVQLTDQLPTNGGLTWTSVAVNPTAQGTCAISPTYLLTCSLGSLAAQGSVTITVSSPSTTPAAACQLQPNGQAGPPIVPGVSVTANGGLTATDWGSLTCSTTPTGPQLSVVKTPKNGIFAPGGQAKFTIVVSNPAPAGSASATNVQLTDQLPVNGGLTWTTATVTPSGQGSCSISPTYLLTCSLGTIVAGGAVMVNVSSPATTPLAACTLQSNGQPGPPLVPGATATATGGLTASDWGSLTCTCSPQLSVVKTPKGGSLGTFSIGGQASFTILVSNAGNSQCSQPATNVQLTDQLPGNGGLTWTTATVMPSTQGSCSINNNLLSCGLGTLAGGAAATVTVSSATTTPPAACTSQPNPAATATAAGGLTAMDSGALNCYPPQLTVVKSPKGAKFYEGSQAVFTIVVSNPAPAGGSPATNVVLTDQLPTNGGLTWASASTSNGSTCTISPTALLQCTLGAIPAQGAVTVTVSSSATTPLAACTTQPNPAATVTADYGLTATDSGSLTCDPVSLTPACGPFLVKYAANLGVGESYITIGNDGSNGAPLNPGLGGATGNICVNVYSFDPAEEMLSCCSCLVTPDQVRYLRVRQDLISTVIGGVTPSSVTLKLVSTLAGTNGSGTSCTNSAASLNAATVVPGVVAWGTTLHATPVAGAYDTTETPFMCASLSQGELASLSNRCAAMIGNLGGFGICGFCRQLP
jgi:uncharacterized repeat protein (TIGR01451 family)